MAPERLLGVSSPFRTVNGEQRHVCELLPIYFVGNRYFKVNGEATDWPAVGMLRYHGIRVNPHWIMQGKVQPSSSSSGWYEGVPWPAGPATRTYPTSTGFTATFRQGCSSSLPEGAACDEFPNRAMAQGILGDGRSRTRTTQPGIIHAATSENGSEGAAYRWFGDRCKIVSSPPGTTIRQIPFDQRFLVIPVAQFDLPTTWSGGRCGT